MRRLFVAVAWISLLVGELAGAGIARAIIVTPYETAGSQAVVDGVQHEWGTTQSEVLLPDPRGLTTTTQNINVLRVGPDAPDIHFETGLPFEHVNARQRTTDQARRDTHNGHRVVAAINGDFWRFRNDTRSPINVNIRNGELIAAGTGTKNALGFRADGTPIIGTPVTTMTLTLPGAAPMPLGGVNQVRDVDEVMLYTRTFGQGTGTTSFGVEVVLSGATLPLPVTGTFTATVESVHANTKNTTIPAGSIILSTTGQYAAALAALDPDDSVEISLSIDEAWQDVVNAVGGLRILVHEGVPATDFTTPSELALDARTAAGITAEGGVIMVTVDGDSDGSAGLAQAELAQLMASLGAVEAINLDGGGSSTFVVDPAGSTSLGYVNVPVEGYERGVNTTLQVVSTAVDPGPVVTAPVVRWTPGTTAGKDDAAVDISWQATPPSGGQIVSTELQKLDSYGNWQPVGLPTATTTSINRRLKFKRDFQYRVRATDDAGNTSEWAVGRTYRINVINEGAAALVRTGKWPVVDNTSAIGGKFGRSSAKAGSGQTAALSYAAVQVAWIGPMGEKGGTAAVRLDGTPAGNVTLTRNTTRARAVLFVGPALDETVNATAPSRTISVTNVSTTNRPFVDLDAFLVLTAR